MATDLYSFAKDLYREFGPPKAMGQSAKSPSIPHFFLLRKFLDEQDLAILFNTKRCRYNCHFCALPAKSSLEFISGEHIAEQFLYVLQEVKHALGLVDRLTIANEGSVFDGSTFPFDTLLNIVHTATALPNIRRLVFETRLEFLRDEALESIRQVGVGVLDILTGFESLDRRIRDEVLVKREPLDVFLTGLDVIARHRASLTTYVLFKPCPDMSDQEATSEARASIEFLRDQCNQRGIPLTIRLNPMYAARGTRWRAVAESTPSYSPPRLTDVLDLAREMQALGTRVYLGLTSEGLSEAPYTYRGRDDFATGLLKLGILNNTRPSFSESVGKTEGGT